MYVCMYVCTLEREPGNQELQVFVSLVPVNLPIVEGGMLDSRRLDESMNLSMRD